MSLGALILLGALALFLKNTGEDKQAEKSAELYLPKVLQQISENAGIETQPLPTQSENTEASNELEDAQREETSKDTEIPADPDYYSTEMTVVMIDGHGFVGYVSLPKLGIELPVLSELDEAGMKLSPCRFCGSAKTEDLVIGAHNYTRHFGKLSLMKTGDQVHLTDMDGKLWSYELVTMEILDADDLEELTKGEYPLTLFTCTYDGTRRIVLRFDQIAE